ncbi:hypothetical protein D3C83_61680 [compost metagenome]
MVDEPGGLEQLELLVEAGEQLGGGLGPDDLGRVAVEGDEGGDLPPLVGLFPDEAQEGLVAEVDAVEGTDGDHGPDGQFRAAVEAPDDAHRSRQLPLPLSALFRTTTGRAAALPFW